MCQTCSCSIPSSLTIDQGRTLAVIRSAWDGVVVYDVDDALPNTGTVLMIGHKGSEYHFSLVGPDGSRQVVTDVLNQSHWLNGAAVEGFHHHDAVGKS